MRWYAQGLGGTQSGKLPESLRQGIGSLDGVWLQMKAVGGF